MEVGFFVFLSISTSIPCAVTAFAEGMNLTGRPVVIFSIMHSGLIPRTLKFGPHIPISVIYAVPFGKMHSSAVATCVCVP